MNLTLKFSVVICLLFGYSQIQAGGLSIKADSAAHCNRLCSDLIFDCNSGKYTKTGWCIIVTDKAPQLESGLAIKTPSKAECDELGGIRQQASTWCIIGGQLAPGTYNCGSSGFGTVVLSGSKDALSGTYTSTYVSSQKGKIGFQFNGEYWQGTWGERAVARQGILDNLVVSEGHVSGRWVVTEPGKKGSRNLPKNSGKFSCQLKK